VQVLFDEGYPAGRLAPAIRKLWRFGGCRPRGLVGV